MKILFVAISGSIHTARWINQISDQGWDIHLFPSSDSLVNPQLRNVTIHGLKTRPEGLPSSIRVAGKMHSSDADNILKKAFRTRLMSRILLSRKLRKMGVGKLFDWLVQQGSYVHFLPEYLNEEERCAALVKTIQEIKPDIIHCMEIQHAGYLTFGAKKIIGDDFPTWIVTNWGSDIYHFGQFPEHAQRIRETLEACDYYSCECERDVKLGRDFGFKGEVLPILPVMGGSDLDYMRQFRQLGPISERKLVVLKGYQGWVYRALVGLKAIELCTDVIRAGGYRLAVFVPSPGVPEAAMELHNKTQIPVEIIAHDPSSNEHILRLHGQARVSIGLSTSDAISTSFLEAIMLGSFPIQSNTGCANEWIECGKGGFLVPPEDPSEIAKAIRQALTDDALVDQAAEINSKTVEQRLAYSVIQPQAIKMYQDIYETRRR